MTIHKSIKETLGYEADISDDQFLKDWKRRSTQVCKPCWELKYCPYGPFVEQSPLLPETRTEAVRHNEYLKNVLKSGVVGEKREISDEEKRELAERLAAAKRDPSILVKQATSKIMMRDILKKAESEGKIAWEYLRPPTSAFEKYKVPYPLDNSDKQNKAITPQLEQAIKHEIETIERILQTGIDDSQGPLDAVRRKDFEEDVSSFDANDYPDQIPQLILDSVCNDFGHICPVVFVGESVTETAEKRRRSRYISFNTKMRVVRRDNYTCQVCGVHLKDDQVEFDHIIPYSKGGSSEEHNIRLTCFDCNRSKSDRADI